ncbi:LytR/AlgR family response regulator transcription factor [Flagellimonas myxillae]|uniref:LytR/AlgR family response regulator transcription factor n=1 Tax=Flagellimonas myxillae TaxID=2942214 RepID=UPI00201F6569|nr:LytTR family DNA-binding domain-containing protein [Muricauda myxillae]MCL6265897.1 LytTR family transcriptional regulator [Muricauda myxillae]
MRVNWSDKKFYRFSIGILVILFVLTLLQNFIRYRNHDSYSIWVSVVYLLVSILLFIPVVIFSVKLQQYLKRNFKKWYWVLIGFTSVVTLGLFYLLSNIILHSIGYFDGFVDEEYARYYFGREALYHLLLLVAASFYVHLSTASTETISVFKGRKKITLTLSLVHWIEAEGHYLNFYTDTDTFVKRERLSAIAKRLNPNFVRIHRKFVVNRSEIKSTEKDKRDEFLVLKSGKRLKIGQSFKPIDW